MLTVLDVLALLTATYWIALWIRSLVLAPPLPRLPLAPVAECDAPLVSVLVAVRNEIDRMLVPSITSAVAQDYPNLEVIAVDDHSEDGSQRMLTDLAACLPRLRVVPAPPGAEGKREALCAAASAARGAWLLFTDADVGLTPDAVRRGVAYATREGVDALSLLPRTVAISLAEQTALAAVSWLCFEGTHLRCCNDDAAPVGLAAAGPYLLVSREAFDAVGGYGAVRQNVLIDVALAQRLREHGFRYRYLHSDGSVATRMYRSLAEIWQGFAKNAFVALGNRRGAATTIVAAAAALTILPLLLAGAGLVLNNTVILALATAAWITMAGAQHNGGAFMGTQLRALALILAPAGALLWVAIVMQSAWGTRVRATVSWKGRSLPVFTPHRAGIRAAGAPFE